MSDGKAGHEPMQGVPGRVPPHGPVSSTASRCKQYPGKIAHNPNSNLNFNILCENLHRGYSVDN